MKWTVILTREDEPNPEDTYAAQCLELPGAISCGDGILHTIEMIKEAIEGWLEMAVKYNDPIPIEGTHIFNLSDLEEKPDYVVLVDVPIPQSMVAA